MATKKPKKQGLVKVNKTTDSVEVKKVRERTKNMPDIFKLFAKWCVIPTQHKRMNEAEIADLGIEDDEWLHLLQIKTQVQFSEVYGVSQKALSKWRREINPADEDAEMHRYFNLQTKELLNAFIRVQKVVPSPEGLKAWYGLIKEKGIDAGGGGIGTKVDLTDDAKAELIAAVRGARKR